MYMFGHRGVNTKIDTENTIRCLLNITEYQHNLVNFGVEFDIQITIYGDIICFHDETLERVHGCDIFAYNLTKEQIKKYSIPLLKDILDSFKDLDYLLDIEIKYFDINNKQYDRYNKIIEMIEDFNMSNKCIITSFDIDIVKFLLIKNIDIATCLIYDGLPSHNLLNTLKRMGMKNIVLNKSCIDNVEYIKELNMDIIFYTVFEKNTDHNKYDNRVLSSISKYRKIYIITDDLNECLKYV